MNYRVFPRVWALALCLLVPWTSWGAPSRHALVLSNSAYSIDPLKNPRADAELMAASLRDVGFNVEKHHNLDRASMYESVRAFSAKLPQGSTAVIYYAGHGMQISGKNYLIPVDMVPTSEAGVAMRAVSASVLTEKLEGSGASVSVVILDACRNNPFRPASPKAVRSYEGLGLAKIVTPRGMVIAYSTAPGQLAEDGASRRNSLYTETLARELRKAGQPIEQVLKNVGNAVRRATFDDQQPWFESSLIEDFYFIPPPGIQLAAAPAPKKPSSSSSVSRGLGTTWFAPMNEGEWQQLDLELDRRAEGVTPDQLPDLQRRAEKGNLVAQTTLGIVYLSGPMIGTSRDRNPGRFQGSSLTTQRMGANNTLALKWLQKAAEAGFPPAQTQLGELYYEGRIVSRDVQQARHWMAKAAEYDYPRARINLAQIDTLQDGTPDAMMRMFQELLPQALPRP